MSSLTQRQTIMLLIDEAVAAGARQARACEVVGLSVRTLADGSPTRRSAPRACPAAA